MNDELKTQLTAWALDELPAEERASIDARLEAQPEARTYAQETREFCTLLERTLAPAAETTTLTGHQREQLARQFRTAAPAGKVVRFRPAAIVWIAGLGAVAAALVIWSGKFASPPGGTVAMDRLNEAPEAASKKFEVAGDATVISNFDSKTLGEESKTEADARGRSLSEHEGLEVAQGLSLEKNSPPGPASGALDRPERFGSHPDLPSKDVASDALAAAATLADTTSTNLGLKVESEKAKSTTWNEPLRADESLAENSLERRAGQPQALGVPPVVAQASGPIAPAPPATAPVPGELSLRTKAGFAESDQSGTSLASGAGDVQNAGSVTRGFGGNDAAGLGGAPKPDYQTRLSLAQRNSRSEERSRAVMDGTTPSAARSLETLRAGGLAPGGGVVTEEKSAALYAKETAPASKAPPEPGVYYRYFALTPAQPGTESYAAVPENPFKAVAIEPLSTFSIDVDTAGYANVRRFLNQGQRPPQDAVRIEEMVNYFRYDYPQPETGKPFSVTVDVADCPWQPQHRLARIGLKGREVAPEKRPNSNLVFLIDVSGSMDEQNKLPLVQQSLRMLSSQLTEKDRVAMVTYAGNSGIALDSTNGADRAKITGAIDQLVAGGSTNGASGIQLAYQVAQQHFIKEGVNRVLLATDGDFNVGVTSQEELQKLITDRAKGGVFLSVLGYGMGNLKDSTMEMLADKGNGNYAYIDSLGEARKVLSEEMSGTLVTIAKDVKIQIEFNPAIVRSYRLLGYENRMLAKEDFNDDKKDAGEIGAGHTVTALYELVPIGAPPVVPPVDSLKYAVVPPAPAAEPAAARKPIDPAIVRETMTVKLRYKAPDGDSSQLIEVPVVDKEAKFVEAPADFKFAASVTMFGMLLKDSAHKGNANWDQVRQFALQGKGPDSLGYRGEFIQLVEKARGLVP